METNPDYPHSLRPARQSKPQKKTVYTAVYDPNTGQSLAALKNQQAKFFKSQFKLQADIKNNPNQMVYPGGHFIRDNPSRTKKRFGNEHHATSAAVREFAEETPFGIDLRNRLIKTNIPPGMLDDHPQYSREGLFPDIPFSENAQHSLQYDPEGQYASLYVPVDSHHLQAMQDTFDTFRDISHLYRSMHTESAPLTPLYQDDELNRLEILRPFPQRIQEPPYFSPKNPKLDGTQQTNWFLDMQKRVHDLHKEHTGRQWQQPQPAYAQPPYAEDYGKDEF